MSTKLSPERSPQERWQELNDSVSKTVRWYKATLAEFEELCKIEKLSKTVMIQKLMDFYKEKR